MRRVRIFTYIFLSVVFVTPFFGARFSHKTTDTFFYSLAKDSIPPSAMDTSVRLSNDSVNLPDSLATDTVAKKKSVLEAVVDYKAKDSIIITGSHWGYLYGDADLKYTNIELKGEKVAMNMDSSIVHATYGLDSIGEEFGYPLLNDNGTEYESESMKYNFKSKKAFIDKVRTQQGDGLMIADQAKKTPDDAIFICNGQYTTCDNPDHHHFYLNLTKAKVRPGKNIVTGFAYLVIEDVPLPIGIPFGFFPFTDKYSSGVIMPTFGTEMERGYNLRDGGYYFAINDNIDLAVTGEIYTKGSWGLNGRSTYRKRYKYSGNFDVGYLKTKLGDKGLPDYSEQTDMRINWTHSQDAKANMYRTISASVNFSTSSYERNNLNSAFTPASTQNTKASSVNLTQRFPNSPWSMSASMNVSQRSRDSSISLTLPNLTITMSRVAPFKRKEAVGSEKWYEKIQLSYTGDFRNSIDTKENMLLKSNLQRDWRNGMKHSIPVSATFSAFNYLNITPSISYTERWYTSKVKEAINSNGTPVPIDTLNGFHRVYDFSGSISLQTKVYGFFEPLFAKGTKIRHVFTPSISFSASPDFSDPIFGFYETLNYYDANGEVREYKYSPYRNGIFGTASSGKSGSINFDFQNNFEMKTPSDKDSTGFKKISLIDNLGISFSHNLMADSLKWSNINTNIRLKLSKSFTINLSAQFDPYAYQLIDNGQRLRKVDKLRIKEFGSIGRLVSTGYSISHNINQDTFKKLFGKDVDASKEGEPGLDDQQNANTDEAANPESGGARQSLFDKKKDDGEYDPNGYLKNDVKWNLGFSFGMNYAWDTSRAPIDKGNGFGEYHGRWVKTFSFNGGIQPTKNWNFTFNSSYDFDAKKVAYTTCNLTRDLHCWSLTASFTPIGPYKTYYVTLRASSQILQDLKYEERGRSSSYDPNWD